MVDMTPFTDEQARALVNLRQHYEAWRDAERAIRALPYDLRRKTVLVVGAGEAGQRAAGALVQNGVGRLLVTTRRSGLGCRQPATRYRPPLSQTGP